MIPGTILFFLGGAVLAWRFRVWILFPITLLAMIGTMMFEVALGAGLVTASGYGLLLGPAPQLGYAFGLLAHNALVLVRSRAVHRLLPYTSGTTWGSPAELRQRGLRIRSNRRPTGAVGGTILKAAGQALALRFRLCDIGR
jgi:hypothetical protein